MPAFKIDGRHELIDKRNLKPRPFPFDDKTILRRAMDHGHNGPTTRPDFQPDQLIRPELLATESALLGYENLQVANPLGSFAIDYFIKRDLISLVGRTNRPNNKRTILNEDC